MSVIVFDLDDTLYEELTFVYSGLKAVAGYLQAEAGIDEVESFNVMYSELHSAGRGKIFDRVLDKHGILTQSRVSRCLSVYRSHKPEIMLYPDAIQCLHDQEAPLYIVTDGHKLVQQRKLEALGLNTNVSGIRKSFISRRFGIHNEKPSPHCFQIICRLENVQPDEVIYVGDNPHKDFVGIKPLGFRTVRIMRGNHCLVEMPPEYEADHRISSLVELTQLI